MDNKLYGCCKCFQKYPLTQLSTGTQLCKNCIVEEVKSSRSYKQCAYCKSDFKQSVPGTHCLKCKTLEEKHGPPSACSICRLTMAFGSTICARCTHYRSKLGDPVSCENCNQQSAFVKDEAGRSKVGGKVLCWLCTYNYKLSRSKERSSLKRSADASSTSKSRMNIHRSSTAQAALTSLNTSESKHDSSLSGVTKRRMDDYQGSPSLPAYSLDSMYNDHLLTISQLQEEIKNLRKQISQKEASLMTKDRTIAELRSDILHMEDDNREKITKIHRQFEDERENMQNKIRELQRQNAVLSKSAKKKPGAKPSSQSNSRNNSP